MVGNLMLCTPHPIPLKVSFLSFPVSSSTLPTTNFYLTMSKTHLWLATFMLILPNTSTFKGKFLSLTHSKKPLPQKISGCLITTGSFFYPNHRPMILEGNVCLIKRYPLHRPMIWRAMCALLEDTHFIDLWFGCNVCLVRRYPKVYVYVYLGYFLVWFWVP